MPPSRPWATAGVWMACTLAVDDNGDFQEFLVKPVGTEQLCQVIERLTILSPARGRR